jgi:DNA-binding protein HU-beta
MNKSDLIAAIAKEAKIAKTEANSVVDATTKAITSALKKGDKVTLVGFGTFSIAKRAARVGRNPQTGKPLNIAAKKVAKFKAGSELAHAVKK